MNKYYVALIASIIAVSFAAILVLLCEAPPLSIAFFRLLFTTLLIIPFIGLRQKTRTELFNISLLSLISMIIIGIILASHFALWISSLTKTSVASSVVLVTSHPILVGPLSWYFLKEKLSTINALGIALSVTGVFVLVYGNYEFVSFSIDSIEGNILALLGGVAAGLYILGGRIIRKNISIFPYAFIVYCSGTITLFLLCLFFQVPIITISVKDIKIIFLMAIIAGIFGHTLYNWSLEYIKASIASVFLLGEPIGSSLLAYVLPSIQQQPSRFTIIGGGVILLGIYLTTRNSERLSKYVGEPTL
ncbi:MAG: DMT family transporter [Thermoplasmatota archaeon]